MAFRQISDLKKSHRHAHTLKDSLKHNAFHLEFRNRVGKEKENVLDGKGMTADGATNVQLGKCITT